MPGSAAASLPAGDQGLSAPGGARAWEQAQIILKTEIGAAAFGRWINPLKFRGLSGDTAQFDAPSDFAADWVRRHYAEEISSAMNEAGAECGHVDVIAGPVAAPPPTANGAAPAPAPRKAEPQNDEQLRSAPLDRKFTFEQFVVGRPNELAYAAARRVAEDDNVVYNPVFLHGGVGLGKTHLMHAISWRISELYAEPEGALSFGGAVHVSLHSGDQERQHHRLQGAVPLR